MAGEELGGVTEQLAKTTVDDTGVLSFAGKGLKLDKEDDAKDIAEAISNFPNMKILRMEGNTMGVEAAKTISKALEKHPEFERAQWSDMFTGRLKTEIPPALTFLSSGVMLAGAKLVELDLSDNAFGPTGINGVVELLKSECCFSLKELRLNNNGLGIGGGKILAKTLLECYKISSAAGQPLALKVFISGRGRLENEGSIALSEAFKAMGSLEEVQMPQNGINHPGITALADAFSQNKNLRILNLNDNTFTVVGAKAMAKALPQMQELENVNFGDCLVRTDGCKALAAALKDGHKKLKELNLSFNEIKKNGAMVLAESMENKDSLEKIDLNGNQLGDEGIELLQGTLEAMDKVDLLGSLSDDEGDEDEEDEEEEEDDENDDDVEEGEISTDPALQIKGQAISPRIQEKDISPSEFLQFPTSSKLKQMGPDKGEEFAEEVKEKLDDIDDAVQLLMKLCSVVTQDDEKTKEVAIVYADILLSKCLGAQGDKAAGVLSNSLLVNLGLLKSEDKKFKPTSNPTGVLLVLAHMVKQEYFPKLTRDILQTFLSRPHKVLDGCVKAKHLLLQSLYQF